MIKSARGVVPFEEVNTLGGEFELDEVPVIAPAPAPEAITADGVVDGPIDRESAPVKEVEI